MNEWLTGRSRIVAVVVAVLCGAALLTQYTINLIEHGRDPASEIRHLYGWFTIWSNTAVALIAGHVGLIGRARGPAHPALLAASAAWILVVGIVYNTLLAGLNHPPTLLRQIIDFIFHRFAPVAWPLWWLALRPAGQLEWRHVWAVLPLPLVYCLFALLVGSQTGRYAYFFIDAGKLGWVQVAINIAGLASLFLAAMALAVWWDRRSVRVPVKG
jgi:hypothetical protein